MHMQCASDFEWDRAFWRCPLIQDLLYVYANKHCMIESSQFYIMHAHVSNTCVQCHIVHGYASSND